MELTSPSNLSPVPSKQTINVRFLWLGGTTLSAHWGSRKVSGNVPVGEEDSPSPSTQLASDLAMREGGEKRRGEENANGAL